MTERPPARATPPMHYGWIMVLATIASVFVALGIGRFALGMLLPAMGAALPLSYLQMGLISTGNFLGYLVGALLAGRFIRRFGERRLIGGSLLLIVVTMAGIAMADGVVVVLLLYLGTGLGSGLAFVATASLLPH
ncbi:MAG: YbfB/YjiJ family MFS transporter, partial [Alphaproteobacteria bacterium]|nr:YbfB/YjiJ family MFS transporter [Alphaproteobacteria bacterium]